MKRIGFLSLSFLCFFGLSSLGFAQAGARVIHLPDDKEPCKDCAVKEMKCPDGCEQGDAEKLPAKVRKLLKGIQGKDKDRAIDEEKVIVVPKRGEDEKGVWVLEGEDGAKIEVMVEGDDDEGGCEGCATITCDQDGRKIYIVRDQDDCTVSTSLPAPPAPPAPPEPPRMRDFFAPGKLDDVEHKRRQLEKAADALRSAGLNEDADVLMRKADKLAREQEALRHRENAPRAGDEPLLQALDELRAEVRGLRGDIQALRKRVEDLTKGREGDRRVMYRAAPKAPQPVRIKKPAIGFSTGAGTVGYSFSVGDADVAVSPVKGECCTVTCCPAECEIECECECECQCDCDCEGDCNCDCPCDCEGECCDTEIP